MIDGHVRLKPLTAEQYEELLRELDEPAKPNAALRELMRRKPIWER